MTHLPSSTDSALLAVGFTAGNDGVLHVPAGVTVTLAPVGRFYQLAIALPTGDVVSGVVADRALKIVRHGVKL